MTQRTISTLILLGVFNACTLSAQDSVAPIYEGQQIYRTASSNLVKGAEEMPAKDYGFQPTAESPSFGDPDCRGNRVAGGCLLRCRRETCGYGTSLFHLESRFDVRTQDVCGPLSRGIFVYQQLQCGEPVRFGGVPHSRLGLLYLNTTHVSEVYGQLAVYLRLKGLVPPSNRARLLPVSGE